MTTRMTLPMDKMPSAIAESVATTLRAHGLTLSPELLREIGNNTTQALWDLEESGAFGIEQPTIGERMSVGETLRALAAAGRPNESTAPMLERVGTWLAGAARAELAAEKGGRAA